MKLESKHSLKSPLYPLLFDPILKDYLWGGTNIATVFGKGSGQSCIAESWEISDREEGQSVISNGPLAGKTLAHLVKNYNASLFGPGYTFQSFPLLIKIIDAQKPLSIQVHPTPAACLSLGGEPKTECWHILECSGQAKVYAGLKTAMTKQSASLLMQKGEFSSHLHTFEARPSQTYFIPSGTVHAIGAGCLLFEVQQNSNTTYRLDDWGRVDKHGKSRELHQEKALASMAFQNTMAIIQDKITLAPHPYFTRNLLTTNEFFHLEEWSTTKTTPYHYSENQCHILFCKEGEALLRSAFGECLIKKGQTVLMPYASTPTVLKNLGEKLTFLHISLPRNS